MNEFLDKMEKREYYQPHVYDQERLQDAEHLVNLQQTEINYYKKKLLIGMDSIKVNRFR